ncbi:threonine aldolase [Bacteroidales bacterium]|nr:threonine aldolase [Bacteroidales bacterium]
MRSFASDNNSGVHPNIMDAIVSANIEHSLGYGDDQWTQKADEQIKSIFGEDIGIYYVFNGTGANVVSLQATTQSFNSIITAQTGHINLDECGAPSKFTSCCLKEIQTKDGKLTCELIKPLLEGFGDPHHSQAKVIYLSQSTEMGTVYTPEDLRAICDLAHQHDMYVHMDGARLANACAYLGLGMRELSRECGIDILSLGGTKNGMMIGELVISFRKELNTHLQYYRKQSAQLYSKMRYLSSQFSAYLKDDLWMANACHANKMASVLEEKLRQFPFIEFTQKVQANALFLIMPANIIEALRKKYFFYTWNEQTNEVRLVCSWDTSIDDIEGFIYCIDKQIK